MSDELNSDAFEGGFDGFDFDAEPETQAPEQPPSSSQPQQEAQSQGLSLEEANQLRQQVQSLTQWQQDAMRVFGGQPQQQADPNTELLQTLVQNPQAFVHQITQQSMQALQQQQQAYALEQKYSQQHPELVPFKGHIWNDAYQIALQAQQQGRSMSDEQAIEQAINQFKSNLSGLQQQNQNQALRQQALKLNPTGAQNPGQGPDIDSMSPAEWDAHWENLKRRASGY